MHVLILFAVSLSLDAVAVGFSYGVKKIRIPAGSLLALFVVSVLMSGAGSLLGAAVSSLLSPQAARWISFLLLLGLGVWMLIDSLRGAREKEEKKAPPKERTFEFMLKSIGLSVKIIKHPVDCDFDRSATIDLGEACYLAFLLSIDAVCSCASLSVGGSGCTVMPALVGLFQTGFLFAGDLAGKYFSKMKFLSAKAVTLLPGTILIVVALLRFFG